MRPSSLSTLRSPYDESSKTAKPTSHVKGKTCNASQKLGKGGSVAGGKSGRQRVSNKSAPTSRNELRSVIKLQAVDLKRVKEEAVVLTADQVELRRRAARELAIRGLEERQKREADEHARKVADARSKLEQECAALTQEQARERQAVVERAEWLRESQIDRVKRMDQLVNYALCATMRSKQIEEKVYIVVK